MTGAFEALAIASGPELEQRVRSLSWVLSPATILHARTGDDELLSRTREALTTFVASGFSRHDQALPLLASFRELPPFCEAFEYLRAVGSLDVDTESRARAIIAASADSHLGSTDWGAHNRATVDAAGFYAAADSVPDHDHAARWRGYGDALIEDSWGRWSIEDASIYGPFWLFYLITASEGLGSTEEFLQKITTRYYFEQYSRLLMPNGMLPDWGDGDWTHMWTWYAAVMIRAAGHYGRPDYQYFAQRLFETHRAMGLSGNDVVGYSPDGLQTGDELYSLATALRWMALEPPPEAVPYVLESSEEIVDDLVSKKIAFRNEGGDDASFALLNYRDPGPYGRYQREYQNQQLFAFEEMPHHGHADENSLVLLLDGGTVLLADGGYRRTAHDGWRADLYHNRLVARLGWPNDHEMMPYLQGNPQYVPVRTEKIHFGTFGALDYSRTRLVDEDRGYTGDRIVLFVPDTGMYIIVDAVHIDREGPKSFTNMWHPDGLLAQGGLADEGSHWVRSWPHRIPIRNEYWTNPHGRELLVQFVGNRDKYSQVRRIDRRFNPSDAFFQFLYGYYFAGQRLGFVTVLTPYATDTFDENLLNAVEILQNGEGSYRTLGLRFDVGGGTATVGMKLDTTIGLTNLRGRPMFDWHTGSVDYDGLRTDADFAFVVDRGKQHEVGLMCGSRLCWEGEILFDMPKSEHMYQGPVDYAVPERKDRMPRWHEVVSHRPRHTPGAQT
ncbi:MAG: hypothetical protein QF689_14070 [Candidatus Latescibacteria bacterium]|nr:hypothetical protein [Candidatus Latescibacterota bacterium]